MANHNHTHVKTYHRIRFMKSGQSHGYAYYVHQPNHDKTATEKRKRHRGSGMELNNQLGF